MNATLDAVAAPVQEAAGVLDRIAECDLTARVPGEYLGEFQRIKTALNQAVENLDEGLSQVSMGAEMVSSAISEINSGSQTLSHGSSEQEIGLEKIISSLAEMASMTRQNTANSKEARSLAEEARRTAGIGRESMERLSEAVDRIKTSAEETAKIVKTIDEIAFQTNLLALNAAVEADRAGDAGKGSPWWPRRRATSPCEARGGEDRRESDQGFG